MNTDALIIEIGTEELPPKSLRKLAESFYAGVVAGIDAANLNFSAAQWFATPKRLAVLFHELEEKQKDQVVEKRGPAVSAAFDSDGKPTKAALGWARGNGIDVTEAERLTTEKGEWLLARKTQAGQHINDLLQDIVNAALKQLPIPKTMRWGDSKEEFVRPIHNLLAMFGSTIVPITIKGKEATNKTQGHRFHSPEFHELAHASEYAGLLAEHYVTADHEQRKSDIAQSLQLKADAYQAHIDLDEDLLEEITALVEHPVVMAATFEERFLKVPKEALIYTMKGDQKYVPLLDENNNLLPVFLFVANIDSRVPESVIKGNEKVIRPRLADAEFFYQNDLKTPFANHIEQLEKIVFQKQLGTVKERVERISSLASAIATQIGANAEDAARAGLLCKNDLVSSMVFEFTSMQGIMGRYYAAASGETEQVATAIGEQYLPAFSGDALPSIPESSAVAIAEKLDTLVGIFATGQTPKGDKDPFALRRATIGILRICVEQSLPLDLVWLVESAAKLVQPKFDTPIETRPILDFINARLKAMLLDQGYDAPVVLSVLTRQPRIALDFVNRVEAVKQFSLQPTAEALAAANKRVANILRKSQEENIELRNEVDASLFTHDAETQLHEQVSLTQKQVLVLAEKGHYAEALAQLAALKQAIDNFFDNVMVNAEDINVRTNRLTLLSNLRNAFLSVADVSLLSL